MHDLRVILTFTGGLAWALILGYIAQRLRISPIVGYLLAGVFVGPFTPGFVADRGIAEQLAEIGVILLLIVPELAEGGGELQVVHVAVATVERCGGIGASCAAVRKQEEADKSEVGGFATLQDGELLSDLDPQHWN